MNTLRSRFDPAFALALALVVLAAVGFVSERNGAATIMCAMCLGGLVAGGIVGVPGRVLLPVAIGFMVVIWMTKIDPPANGNEASAFAHAIGGGLVGWALVEALRPRIRDWLSVALVALSVVIVLTLVWEIGEYAGDRLFDTSLDPGWRDSAIDIFFGTAGGIVGIAFAGLAVSLRRANQRGATARFGREAALLEARGRDLLDGRLGGAVTLPGFPIGKYGFSLHGGNGFQTQVFWSRGVEVEGRQFTRSWVSSTGENMDVLTRGGGTILEIEYAEEVTGQDGITRRIAIFPDTCDRKEPPPPSIRLDRVVRYPKSR